MMSLLDLSSDDYFFIALVIVVVAMFFYARRFNRLLSAWARQNGFKYIPAKKFGNLQSSTWYYTLDGKYDNVWFRQYAEFYPFDSGTSQRVWEQLVKEEGDAIWRIFRFDSDRGAEGKSHLFWICTVNMPVNFPALQIRPTGLLDRIAGLFGKRDIATGHEEFDKEFHVSGENEAFARDFLDADMRKFLVSGMTFRWQVHGQHAMLVWPDSYKIKDVERMVFALRTFLKAMPQGVLEKYGQESTRR